MEQAKQAAEIFSNLGAGNAAILLLFGLFSWYFIKVLPKSLARQESALEEHNKLVAQNTAAFQQTMDTMRQLGSTFEKISDRQITHDTQTASTTQQICAIQAQIADIAVKSVTQEGLIRLHDRLDEFLRVAASKDDIAQLQAALHEDAARFDSLGGTLNRIAGKVGA